jgi:ABC-type glutathione transport system ATPase component
MRGEKLRPILKAERITKQYEGRGVLRTKETFHALAGVSLSIYPQSTLAVVGPSGSGKSTLALCLACLEPVTSGKIWFEGKEITALREEQLRSVRPKIQLIFQDPASSLNPRLSASEVVTEPLNVQKRLSRPERVAQARRLLERVGIPSRTADQRPGEFSGGQRQRIAIARALALEPKVLILDEALAALDCSLQAQVANLLLELQSSLGLTYVFITHDLAMATHLADEIIMMDQGNIVETGTAADIILAPKHEVTKRLLAAAGAGRALHVPQVI